MLTAHALSIGNLKKSIEMGARAYLPKEKMADIVPFLKDVLTLEHRAGWRRLFNRLTGFFTTKFGPDWQQGDREFWDRDMAGKMPSEPVILRK
jgi:hypothetical protein